MDFIGWLENRVLAHIAGPSGSGKTTLANKLAPIYPNISFKDLDEFDEEAEHILGYDNVKKIDYTDEMLAKLASVRQSLLNDFIKKANRSIIFVGHHTEGNHVLSIPTKNRMFLNVDAKTSALRNFSRSKLQKINKSPDDLSKDELEAQEIIDWLADNGYKPLSQDEIISWLKDQKL